MKKLSLATKPVGGVLKADEYAEYVHAKDVIEDADRMRRHADHVIRDAEKRGYQKGLDKVKQELSEEMIKAVVNTTEYFSSVERDVAQLVLATVRKILSDFDDEKLVLDAVRRGLELLRKNQRLLLRVGPQMAPTLKQKLPEVVKDMDLIDVIPDDRLTNRDCLLESDIGIVDANIDRQLAAIEQVFSERLGISINNA